MQTTEADGGDQKLSRTVTLDSNPKVVQEDRILEGQDPPSGDCRDENSEKRGEVLYPGWSTGITKLAASQLSAVESSRNESVSVGFLQTGPRMDKQKKKTEISTWLGSARF